MVRITNTGEQITDTDLTDEALQASFPAAHVLADAGITGHADDIGDDNGDNGDNGRTDNGQDDTPESDETNITDDMILRQKKIYLGKVKKIGETDGLGKKAILIFAETIVEGAMNHNAIVPADAEKFYKAFKDASTNKSVLDDGTHPVSTDGNGDSENNPKSLVSQVSKLGVLIKLGNDFKDADRNASDIVRRARNLHIDLMKDAAEKKLLKYKSTYQAVVEIARAQRGDDYKAMPMTEEEMRSVLQGAEKPAKTGADLLLDALKLCESARKGRAPDDSQPGREAVSHTSLDDAIDNLHAVLSEVAPDALDKHVKAAKKAQAKLATAAFQYAYQHRA